MHQPLVLGVSSTHRDSTSTSIRTQILSLEILVFCKNHDKASSRPKVSAQDRVTYRRNWCDSRRNLFSRTCSNDDSNFKDNIFENRNACAAANIRGLMAWNLVNGILGSRNRRYGSVCTEYLFMFLRRLALNRLNANPLSSYAIYSGSNLPNEIWGPCCIPCERSLGGLRIVPV